MAIEAIAPDAPMTQRALMLPPVPSIATSVAIRAAGRGHLGRDVRIRTEVVRCVRRTNSIAMARRGATARVIETRCGRRADLREARTARSLATFDEITRYTDIVSRCGPGEIDLVTVRSDDDESARCRGRTAESLRRDADRVGVPAQ